MQKDIYFKVAHAVTNHVKVFNNVKKVEDSFYLLTQISFLGTIVTIALDVYQITSVSILLQYCCMYLLNKFVLG